MNFDMILSFFIIGILPVYIYLTLYRKEYTKLKGLVLASIFFLFPVLVFYLYTKTATISFGILDILLTASLTIPFNYLALTGKIGTSHLLKSAITILLFFFSSLLQLIPVHLFSLDIHNLNPVVTNFLTLFSDTFLLIILVLMYYNELKNGIIKLKKNFNEIFDISFRLWLMGFVGMIVSNLLINVFFPGAVSGNENSVQELISVQPLVMLITAGIIGPIIEELVFRTINKKTKASVYELGEISDHFKRILIFIL